MTVEEAKKMIEELKAQGETEEDIVAGFYAMFCEGDIDVNELGDLVQLVGYELTDEFKNLSDEDKKTKGWAEDPEDAKELEEGEEEEESAEEEKEEPAESEEDKEKADEEKARKLFGL